jgi:hypothetical protein
MALRHLHRFMHLVAASPRVLRRRRARGGLTHEQFKDACVILETGAFAHCFLVASVWWARNHHEWTNWLGVGLAAASAASYWALLIRQAYTKLENEVAKEIAQ